MFKESNFQQWINELEDEKMQQDLGRIQNYLFSETGDPDFKVDDLFQNNNSTLMTEAF